MYIKGHLQVVVMYLKELSSVFHLLLCFLLSFHTFSLDNPLKNCKCRHEYKTISQNKICLPSLYFEAPSGYIPFGNSQLHKTLFIYLFIYLAIYPSICYLFVNTIHLRIIFNISSSFAHILKKKLKLFLVKGEIQHLNFISNSPLASQFYLQILLFSVSILYC